MPKSLIIVRLFFLYEKTRLFVKKRVLIINTQCAEILPTSQTSLTNFTSMVTPKRTSKIRTNDSILSFRSVPRASRSHVLSSLASLIHSTPIKIRASLKTGARLSRARKIVLSGTTGCPDGQIP
jgi:hypothetical protein